MLDELTDFQKKLLLIIQHDAEITTTELAKKLNCEERKITYHIDKFSEQNILIEKAVFIDLYPLGYTDYQIFFNLSTGNQDKRAIFIKALCSANGVSWVARTGGEYEFVASILAKSTEEIDDLLYKLGSLKQIGFYNKAFVVKKNFTAYPRKYLAPEIKNIPKLSFGNRSNNLTIDELDWKILSLAANHPFKSIRYIANQLKENHGTVQRRWGNLKQANIIKGIFYRMNANVLNSNSYRLLIENKGFDRKKIGSLRKLAEKNPYILRIIENIGIYDFEIDIEVPKATLVLEIMSEIRLTLEDELLSIKSLQIFHHLKYSSFPFKTHL